jgi:ATP-dependent RNA helicase RhlE
MNIEDLMSFAVIVRNVPSTVPDFVFKQILHDSHVRYERTVHFTPDPQQNGFQTAYFFVKDKPTLQKALSTLNECEIDDQILVAEETSGDFVTQFKEKEEKQRKKALHAKGIFPVEDKITPDKVPDPAELAAPFHSMNLHPDILRNLDRMGIKTPSPIQALAIPLALEGKDVIGRAQTGTGKTLAFAIPIINKMLNDQKHGVRALILAPTRELAIQTQQVFDELLTGTEFNATVIYGGENILDQIVKIRKGIDVLIATPGRLLDMQGRGRLRFDMADFFVLDEADRMMDMGFIPDVSTIHRCFYDHPQTMLFTATTPREFMRETTRFLKDPAFVDVGAPDLSPLDAVEQEIIRVHSNDKDKKLEQILKKETGPTIVFTSTKKDAERIASWLAADGFLVNRVHGDIEQDDRIKAVNAFRAGAIKILIATDVAARGLDIEGVEHIINYDVPQEPEDHLHRIGRTARAGATGKATTFVTKKDERTLHEFEIVFGKKFVK